MTFSYKNENQNPNHRRTKQIKHICENAEKKIVKPSQKGVDSFFFTTAEFLVQDRIPLFTSKNLPVDLHFTAYLTAP